MLRNAALALNVQSWAAPIVFPSTSSSWNNQNGSGTGGTGWIGPYAFENQYITQSFTLPGLAVIGSANFNFSVFGNSNNNTVQTWTIRINSIAIGTYAVSVQPLTQFYDLSFVYVRLS